MDSGPKAPRHAILHAKGTLLAGFAFLLLGFFSGGLATLDTPGYELAEILTIVCALFAPFAALPVCRLERARPNPSPAAAALVASALLLLVATAAFLGSALRAALGPCQVFSRVAFFLPLLVLPTSLLAGSTATAASFLARFRTGRTAFFHAIALALSLVVTLSLAYRGPTAFGHDVYLGLWPGPGVLYDEPLVVDARVILWRLCATALGVAVLSLSELVFRLRRSRPAGRAVLVFATSVGSFLSALLLMHSLGLDGSRAAIREALGKELVGKRCLLVVPSEKPRTASEALLDECEFHAADISHILLLNAPPRITVYVYRSAGEKRLLTGAGRVDYVKPWLPEIHIVDQLLPHPSLRHELVHALAAELAPGPLHVPAVARIVPVSALVEGLAVALDVPHTGFTVDELARAAREKGLLPDPVDLFSPLDFFKEGQARSYGTAGSFVRFVLARYGAAALGRAYFDGDLERATNESWRGLKEGYLAYLDRIPVSPGLLVAAESQYATRSAFQRRCSREETALQAEASGKAAAGRTNEACALLARAGAFGDAGRAAKASGDLYARAGDLSAAEAAYDEALRTDPRDEALRREVAKALGDVDWQKGETGKAVAAWTSALANGPDEGEGRLLEAKILAASDPELSVAARPYLLGTTDVTIGLALAARVQHPLAAYLVGRALATRGESFRAIGELAEAVSGNLPPLLRKEAGLLLAEMRCSAGEPLVGKGELEALLPSFERQADRERALLDVRRCDFGEGRSATRP